MRLVPLSFNNLKDAATSMKKIGVSPEGIKIMAPKMMFYVFKIEGISSYAANIIKQHMLSFGSDAAISRLSLVKPIKGEVIIFGTLYQINKLAKKLRNQPFELKDVSVVLESFLKKKEYVYFHARDKKLKFRPPLICGIVNVTPDSFSGDGILRDFKTSSKARAPRDIEYLVLKKVEKMVKEGAKMIDIGGESSRPFSSPVSEKEEISRVIPAISAIRKRFPSLIISVDTYKYRVAREAIEHGADVINDITAMRHSPRIAELVRKYHLGCVIMHMKGTPRTMQIRPFYRDLMGEIMDFLEERLQFLKSKGILREHIMVDPGIGFGKRVEDNLKIINNLFMLKGLGYPIFLGFSRKSFIGKILKEPVERRLVGSIASAVISFLRGADVLRVHDVRETYEALRIGSAIVNSLNYA